MELKARGLGKAYGSTMALSSVDLAAGPGVTVLLGPNGAGKSTLLRMLATVSEPDAGEISLGGFNYKGNLRALRRHIGYQPQHVKLPDHLTPLQLLEYIALLKSVPVEPQGRELLERLGLEEWMRRPIGERSGGQKRRITLAQALLGNPRLLLLDEPTAGLDPQERRHIARLVQRLGDGRIVIWSSHVPSEVEGVAGQVMVLDQGRVLYAGPPDVLRWHAAEHVHEVTVSRARADILLQQYCVSRVSHHGGQTVLRIVGDFPQDLVKSPVDPSLEDAYLWLRTEGMTA